MQKQLPKFFGRKLSMADWTLVFGEGEQPRLEHLDLEFEAGQLRSLE